MSAGITHSTAYRFVAKPKYAWSQTASAVLTWVTSPRTRLWTMVALSHRPLIILQPPKRSCCMFISCATGPEQRHRHLTFTLSLRIQAASVEDHEYKPLPPTICAHSFLKLGSHFCLRQLGSCISIPSTGKLGANPLASQTRQTFTIYTYGITTSEGCTKMREECD